MVESSTIVSVVVFSIILLLIGGLYYLVYLLYNNPVGGSTGNTGNNGSSSTQNYLFIAIENGVTIDSSTTNGVTFTQGQQSSGISVGGSNNVFTLPPGSYYISLNFYVVASEPITLSIQSGGSYVEGSSLLTGTNINGGYIISGIVTYVETTNISVFMISSTNSSATTTQICPLSIIQILTNNSSS